MGDSMMQKNSKILNIYLEKERLKSFELRWPLRHFYSSRLAAAGFYSCFDKTIACFECQLIVENWDKNTDPWEYHVRHAPRCRFVRGLPCDNVPLTLDNEERKKDEMQRRPVIHHHHHQEEGHDVCGPYDMSVISKNLEDRKRNMAIGSADEAGVQRVPLLTRETVSNVVPNDDITKVIYRFEENRLKSFELWPIRFISPRQLSAAGFYYLGKNDIVHCFECEVAMSKWEKNDDPWTDHVRHSPRCRFVRNLPCGNVPLRGNEVVRTSDNGTVGNKIQQQQQQQPPVTHREKGEGHDVRGAFDMSQLGKTLEGHKRDSIVTVIFGANERPVRISLRELREAKHPRYADRVTRLATFNSWPCVGTQPEERLAKAGFYFTGLDDLTICYYCGIQLRNWTREDEPLQKHARLSPMCNYVARVVTRRANRTRMHFIL